MSVAGDIIDELKISRRTKFAAMSALCSAISISVFATVVMTQTPTDMSLTNLKTSSAKLLKHEVRYSGNTPRFHKN